MDTNRRTVFAGLGIAGAAIATGRSPTASAATPGPNPSSRALLATDPTIVVDTRSGRVRGYRHGDVRIFKGIPYAGPTGGTARFLPPSPASTWSGVRSSLAYGPVCPQQTRTGWANDEEAFLFHWDDGFADEDCLRLNVWSRMPGGGRLPVMVWIHGGGYTAGSSQELPAYDGERLAALHGVVLVSVNHRLGPLGYLDLSGLGDERYRHSGNAGMLDLVAALEWVRDNIVQFGGDPGNVTIFGQSGGGSKVTTLMGMPAAKGLFHRAIVQSGSFPLSATTDSARAFARRVLNEAGVGHDLDRLSAIPPAALIAAGAAVLKEQAGAPDFGRIGGPGLRLPGWSPVVDGDVIPEAPFARRAPAISRHVPLIVGSTRDEFGGGAGEITQAQLEERLAPALRPRREAILAAFRSDFPHASTGGLAKAMAAMGLRNASIEQAAMHADGGGAPAFLYWFTWGAPVLDGRWGSFHCLDLAFSFDNAQRWDTATGNSPEAQQLASVMSGAWTAFARSGDPSQPGLAWPRFSRERIPTMVFDAQTRAVNDPARGARESLRN